MGDLLVSLQPPAVTNLFNLLNDLYRGYGLMGPEVNIMNALLVISVFSTHLVYNSLLLPHFKSKYYKLEEYTQRWLGQIYIRDDDMYIYI